MCCIDFLSYLVAVLSTLVTLLIGFQIYNHVRLKSDMRDIVDKELITLRTQMDNLMSIKSKEVIGIALYNIADSCIHSSFYFCALTNFLKAVVNLYEVDPKSDEVNICFEKINSTLDIIKKINIESDFDFDSVLGYLSLLDGLNDRRKDDVTMFFLELKKSHPKASDQSN